MSIGVLAIVVGIMVAAYNLIMGLRGNKTRNRRGNKETVKIIGKSLVLGILAYIVVININFAPEESGPAEYATEESILADYATEESIAVDYPAEEQVSAGTETETELPQAVQEYTFRNRQLLDEHYEKHGIYMKYKSAEKYLKGANRVINDKDTLHAVEAEDGDDVYYLEKTNEFVVVSGDGYIRTYFCPEDGIEYFHRQSE